RASTRRVHVARSRRLPLRRVLEPGERLGESRLGWKQLHRFLKRLARFGVGFEAHDRAGIAEPCFGRARGGLARLLKLSTSALELSRAAEELAQTKAGLDVVRIVSNRSLELFDRFGILAARCEEHTEAVVRRREVRGATYGFLELFERTGGVA